MRVSWPRQLAIFLCRKFTGASLHEIGHQFGGRNHATVINAVKRVEEKLRVDPEALHAVESLSTQLREQQGDRAH
jgi:chromosomal replication initiator protein